MLLKNVFTLCISKYHVNDLKETNGIKNVTLKDYWEE